MDKEITGIEWIKLTKSKFKKIPLVVLVSIWNHLHALEKYHVKSKPPRKGKR